MKKNCTPRAAWLSVRLSGSVGLLDASPMAVAENVRPVSLTLIVEVTIAFDAGRSGVL